MSTVEELTAAIGVDATAKLLADFGGLRLYVPHQLRPDDPITRSIGFSAALKLARLYGGDRVEVPNSAARRAKVLSLRASGSSVSGIARELRCTTRRVYQILAQARAGKAAD